MADGSYQGGMAAPAAQRVRERPETDEVNALIAGIVGDLEAEASRRVGARSSTEARMIDDLRLYHGQYDAQTLDRLTRAGQSTAFINLVGPKTDAFAARLSDLLFPSDARNWAIQPSPVPEMDRLGEELEKRLLKARSKAADAQAEFEGSRATDPAELAEIDRKREEAEAEADEVQRALDELAETRREAQRRASLMQDEMDDQLKATRYQAECRDMIEDAAKLGTGILFGPVLSEKQYLRWIETPEGYALVQAMDFRPGYKRRDPWGFFPDPEARSVDECEGFFYRHLLTRKELRKLARRPGVDQGAIRRLLRAEPEGDTPTQMADLYSLTGDAAHRGAGKYHVWEYIGPIEADKLAALIRVYDDRELFDEVFGDGEIDPLTEIHARVEFCQGEVISFALHPLESNEPVYTVFNVKKAEVGLFGYGIPYLMRDAQASFNGAWRAMLDNARMAVGPQIVVNTDVITAQDNSYSLEPFKIWKRVSGEDRVPAFETYEIPMNQSLLGNIVEMSRLMMDEVTSMPQIAQGEQGSQVTKTAQGMALLMNAANVVFRRVVSNFDDDVTIPNIRRLYDFNMQFSDKEEIKGDFEPVALGSSVLMVREMQSQTLMTIAETFARDPEYSQWLNKPELMREIFKALMVVPDNVLRSEREVQEAQSQMQGQTNPEVEIKVEELNLRKAEIEAKREIAQLEAQSRIQVAQLNYQAQMEAKAADLNAKLTTEEQRIAANERRLATEVAMAQRTGKSAGGNV